MSLPNTAEIPPKGLIQLNSIVDGLEEHLASLGFTGFSYEVISQPKQRYNANGNPSYIDSGTAKLILDLNGASVYLNNCEYFHTIDDLVHDVLFRLIGKYKLELYFEILTGKYKGSIGKVRGTHWIDLGKDPTSKKTPSQKFLSKRNMRLRTDVDAPTLVFEQAEIVSLDSFENTNNPGDIIVYIESGRLEYGTFVQFDTLNRRLILKTSNGRETSVATNRNMMNVTKMPATVMRNEILKAQLVRGL